MDWINSKKLAHSNNRYVTLTVDSLLMLTFGDINVDPNSRVM